MHANAYIIDLIYFKDSSNLPAICLDTQTPSVYLCRTDSPQWFQLILLVSLLLIAYHDADVSSNKEEMTFSASFQTMLIQHSIWPIWGFMKATVGFLIYGFTLIHLQ